MNTLWGTVAVLLSSSLAAGLLVNFLTWRAAARDHASASATAFLAPPAGEPFEDLDDVLAQSFPASDPPSSNPGSALVSAVRR